jgi:hypothetical protein
MLKEVTTIGIIDDSHFVRRKKHKTEIELLEEWLTEDPSDGYCMENTIQDEFVELYEELNSLEEKIISQRLHIQDVKSELEEEDIVLKDNEDKAAKHNRKKMLDKSSYNSYARRRYATSKESDNKDIHPRIELDKEIDGLWMLMRRTSKRRYKRKRRTTNKIVRSD